MPDVQIDHPLKASDFGATAAPHQYDLGLF